MTRRGSAARALVLHASEDGLAHVQLRPPDGSAWVKTQHAKLQMSTQVMTQHLAAIYSAGEADFAAIERLERTTEQC